MFIILLTAHVGDLFCVSSVVQLFLSAVAVFYLTIQCGWRLTVPVALFAGLLLDVSFGCSGYFYTFFLPFVPVVAASYWRRHGDCGNIVMQVIPIFLLSIFSAATRLLITFQWGGGGSQWAFVFIYFLFSCVLNTAFGTVFVAVADEFAGHVGVPLFSAAHKTKRR